MADSGFRHELDINTLSWVKNEIDTTLEQAHKALEAYEESPEDDSQVKFCLNYLHQVHGTLKMVELYGASLVAEELEKLTIALSKNEVSNKNEAFQVLIKGMVQLPDYLENLLVGHTDMPVILLPLLNDMRACRGANLLTENALFSPDLDVTVPEKIKIDDIENIEKLAKKLRHTYHKGLLHWFKNNDAPSGIKQVSSVIEQLRHAANDSEVNKLLWITSGVMEGLSDGGLESSIAVKLLVGNVDREIKKIIDKGETEYPKTPAIELVKNLLYYVSCTTTDGKLVKAIKDAFNLQDIMPNTKTLEKARADLAGPNAALMQTVSAVLMEELTQVKDNLDVFVRSENKDVEHLSPLSASLLQMSDTLGMLGLGIQRTIIKEQKHHLDLMISGEQEINDSVLMDIASSLLNVENSLNDLGKLTGNKFNSDTVEKKLEDAEKHKLLKSVISEAKVDLANVKESLTAFSRDPSNHEVLLNIPNSLAQIKGSLSILNLDRASTLLEQCNQYIQKDLIADQLVPELETLETLADAISSIEYFLESLAENWGQPDAILEVAEQSLKKIRGENYSVSNPALNLDSKLKPYDSNATDEIKVDKGYQNSFPDFDGASLDDSADISDILKTESKNDITNKTQEIDGSSFSFDSSDNLSPKLDSKQSVVNLNFEGTQSEEFVLEPNLSLEVNNDNVTQTNVFDGENTTEIDLEKEQSNSKKVSVESDLSPPNNEGTPDPFEFIELENLSPSNKIKKSEAGQSSANQNISLIDKLSKTLLLWYENSAHEEIIVKLEKLLGELKDLLNFPEAENALKIVNDMQGIVKCVVTGEESLNDDLINTLNWAKDTLADLLSDLELNVAIEKTVNDTFSLNNNIELAADAQGKNNDILNESSQTLRMDGTNPLDVVERTDETLEIDLNDSIIPRTDLKSSALADIDEEIIEIFMEEAQEEFDNIIRVLSIWKENLSDDSSLKDMRRSFHTLKGSGRLVGAQNLGEFAWSFENMLNHVVDGAITTSPILVEALDHAVKSFPILFEQITTGEKPNHQILKLMEIAEALSLGKSIETDVFSNQITEQQVSDTDTATQTFANNFNSEEFEISIDETTDNFLESELDISTELSEQNNSESEALANINVADGAVTEEIVVSDFTGKNQDYIDSQELELSKQEISAQQASDQDGVASIDLSIADTAESEMSQDLSDAVAAIETDEDVETQILIPEIEPALLEIYQNEANSHLEALHQYLHDWKNEAQKKSNSNLVRVLHTLKGSSRTTGLIPLADVCYEFEMLTKFLYDNEIDLNPDVFKLLQQTVEYADTVVSLVDKTTAIIPDPSSLVNNIKDIHSLIKSQAPNEPNSSTPENDSEADNHSLLNDYDEELLEIFLEEGIEILDDSDHCIHDWMDDIDNPKHIEALQRYLHTLKGGARMAGISEIGNLSHSIESMLTAIVDGKLQTNDDVFKVLQRSHDQLVKMLEQIASRQVLDSGDILLKQVNALIAGEPFIDFEQHVELHDNDHNLIEEQPEIDESELAGKISEALYENLSNSSDVFDLQDNVIAIDSNGLPSDLVPAVADITPIDKKELALRKRSSGEQVRVRADLLDSLVNFAGEVSIYRSRMEQQINTFRYNLVEFDDTVLRLRAQLRHFEIEAETQIQSRYQIETSKSYDGFDPLEFDRFTLMQQLSRGMLESLTDLDSLRGILSNLTRESETLLVQQSRVNTELQEGLMRTRMVPFSGQISRLRRIVRQTAEELDKDVELKLIGTEHEIDRTVLERTLAPLEHMLRNAVAHGIELSDVRESVGKDKKGNISLIVAKDGSDLVITVSDDGQGINIELIREKAIESGKLDVDEDVSDQDLYEMILESGFSTSDDVTQISGRGVGMDVVNSEVQQLGGTFKIESEQGQGSKFTIRLPLTLSIARALMVNIADELYALPLLSVQGIERIATVDADKLLKAGNAMYHWVGEDYKLIHLASEMGLANIDRLTDTKMMPLLLVRSGEHRAAIIVDSLLGSREIVVKNIGPDLSVLRGISGATILGDGSVVLILDLSILIQLTLSSGYQSELIHIDPEYQKVTNVMVVDDSITVRKVTTRLLERHEMNVITAKDGVDALAQLIDVVPDVMLLDVEMPRMDGFELASNMRNDSRLKNIPIIMITSRTGDKHRDRAFEIGVNAYLGKPYQEIELLENINKLVKK